MIRTLLFGIVWAVIFGLVTLLGAMVSYAILGLAGINSWEPSTVFVIGRCMFFLCLAAPAVGFILGLAGILPGARPNPHSSHEH